MKIKLNAMLSLSLLLILLVGCETQQVTEEEVVRPEEVRFFTHTPGDFVDKGTVTATSRPKMTVQEKQDYFIQELTRQAAQMGANGLLINYRGAQPSQTVQVYRNGRYIPVPRNTRTVEARAIVVRRRN
jgi:hypothetical protein